MSELPCGQVAGAVCVAFNDGGSNEGTVAEEVRRPGGEAQGRKVSFLPRLRT